MINQFMRITNSALMVFCSCLFICSVSMATESQNLWVDTKGDGDYIRIQDAVDAAQDGDTIRVVQGTYTDIGAEVLKWVDKHLKIYGGYQHVNGRRDPDKFLTTISGENVRRGIYTNGLQSDSEFSGFTITECFEGSGSGMRNDSSHLSVSHCRFIDNQTPSFTSGGGVFNFLSDAFFVRCEFFFNKASNGAGMHNSASDVSLTDCLFAFNENTGTFRGHGAGMFNNGSNPILNNCEFRSNIGSSQGGGMYNNRSSPVLSNCIFSMNTVFQHRPQAARGAGMFNRQNSHPIIINCVFSLNEVFGNRVESDSWGNAIFNSLLGDAFPTIVNTILWDGGDEIGGDTSGLVVYSNIQGGFPGEGNINSDPLFVDAQNGDLRLSDRSPSIDTGTAKSASTTDIEGRLRPDPQTNGIDMGAYEYKGEGK